MYNQEFNESKAAFMKGIRKTNTDEISFEDREFLKMMNENSREVGKHYKVPLTLKNPATTKRPGNRYLAEKRLLSLKKRFLKHLDFYSDYKGFVEELIDKVMQANLIKKPQKVEHGISRIMVYTTLASLGR